MTFKGADGPEPVDELNEISQAERSRRSYMQAQDEIDAITFTRNSRERRHVGADGGMHHRVKALGPGVPGRLPENYCPCGCMDGDNSTDPLDILARTRYDPTELQERAAIDYQIESRARILDEQRIRFSVRYE